MNSACVNSQLHTHTVSITWDYERVASQTQREEYYYMNQDRKEEDYDMNQDLKDEAYDRNQDRHSLKIAFNFLVVYKTASSPRGGQINRFPSMCRVVTSLHYTSSVFPSEIYDF